MCGFIFNLNKINLYVFLFLYLKSGKDNNSPHYSNSICKTPDKITGRDQLVRGFSKCNDNLLHNSVLSRAWSEIQIASKIR